MSEHRERTKLGFETLEPRTMLAGDVDVRVVDGDLVVTGDDLDNDIAIFRTDNVGEYVVTGTPTGDGEQTLINGKVESPLGGATSYFQGVTGDFRISLGGGDDRLNLSGGLAYGQIGIPEETYDTPLVIPDDLVITATDGNNWLFLRSLEIGDYTRISTGPGDDTVRLFESRMPGHLALRTGAGNDSVWLRNMESNATVVKTYGGTDSVAIDGMTTEGALFLRTGSEADELSVRNTSIGASARLYTSFGDDDIVLESLLVADRLKLRTEAGADAVAIANTDVGDDLFVDLGTGDDLACVLGSSSGDDVRLHLDGGDDTALIGGLDVADRFTLYGGRGDDLVKMDGRVVDWLLADAEDQVPDFGVDLGRLRAPLDAVSIEGADFGMNAPKAAFVTGKGIDDVSIRDSIFARKLSVALGRGDDSLELQAEGRRAVLNGGPGNNTFDQIGVQFDFPLVLKNLDQALRVV